MTVGVGLAILITSVLAGCGADSGPDPGPGERRVQNFGFTNVASNDPPVAPGGVIAASQAKIAPESVMRFTIQWRIVQPQPGAPFDFTRYDEEIVESALAEGLKPLIVVSAAPEWAWGDEQCDPVNLRARGYCIMPPGQDAASLAAWRAFVTEVARRYADDAVAIEIWNEPNAGGFWNTLDRPDPAHYADLLCHGHDAINGVAPDLPVVSGGLATSFATDDRHVAASDFLAQLYQAVDFASCADGIGVHPYPGQEPPEDPDAPFHQRLDELRAIREENGDHLPLWITEFGYSTRGTGAISEEAQAQHLACAVAEAAAMPDVRSFVVHTLIDRGTAALAELSFGVLRTPQPGLAPEPKPAADALTRALSGPRPAC
jgi:hypothetical protein